MLRLTYERERKGWNKSELCFKARIQPAELTRIESGRNTKPYEPMSKRLEEVFGIPIEELLKEVDLQASNI